MEILVECYADNLLIKLIGFNCQYDHSGIGNVARRMETKFRNDVVLGVIDNDITKPTYFRNFDEIRSHRNAVFSKHRTRNDRYLIVIRPDIEGLIFDAANEVGLNLFTIEELKKMSKSQHVAKNSKFVNYLTRIIALNPTIVEFLRGCINQNIHL